MSQTTKTLFILLWINFFSMILRQDNFLNKLYFEQNDYAGDFANRSILIKKVRYKITVSVPCYDRSLHATEDC